MLTFINSIILSALAAATIPLIIHLFNKQRTKKVMFSSLRFLKKLDKQRLKKIKLYQYILIIIRTFLIVFLVLAFARPTLTGNWQVLQSSSARTTAVILLDDGFNMRQYDNTGYRFSRAINKINDILKSFNPEDKVSIIKGSSPQNIIVDSLDIETMDCSFQVSNFQNSINHALKIFQNNPNFNKELYIVSDFLAIQRKAIDLLREIDDINIYLINPEMDGEVNISIDSLYISNQLFEVNKPISFDLFIRNHSENNAKTVTLHLFVQKQRVAQTSAVINANEVKRIPISFQPRTTGILDGYIEIDDDDLMADNKYYFSINIPDKINFLFVDSSPSLYLNTALETINNETYISIVNKNFNTMASQSFNNFDAICLSNLPELSTALISRLKTFLNGGGGLIIIPGQQTLPQFFNRNFSQLIDNISIQNLVKVKDKSNFFTLKRLSKNNPIISGLLRTNQTNILLPKIYQYFKFIYPDSYQEIIELNSGDPYLLKSNNSIRNIMIFSSYFDIEWTDIQFKGVFLPLLTRVIKMAGIKGGQNDQRISVGEEYILDSRSSDNYSSYNLIFPDGEKIAVIPTITEMNLSFKLDNFYIPGNYKFELDGQINSVISVNVEAKKVKKPTFDIEEILSDNKNVKFVDVESNINNLLQEARFGEELWRYAIIIAIIFLLLELLFVKRIEGRNRNSIKTI